MSEALIGQPCTYDENSTGLVEELDFLGLVLQPDM